MREAGFGIGPRDAQWIEKARCSRRRHQLLAVGVLQTQRAGQRQIQEKGIVGLAGDVFAAAPTLMRIGAGGDDVQAAQAAGPHFGKEGA